MPFSGRTLRAVLLCLLIACLVNSQIRETRDSHDSCRTFAQRFYDWYVAKAQFEEQQKYEGPTLNLALKYKRFAFDPNLVRQIEDAEAEARREQEAFLDFDPILNSQDPAEHYEVRHITQNGQSCRADVYSNYPASVKSSLGPNVTAEAVYSSGHWAFVDFHYPNTNDPANESLVSMLKRILRTRPTKKLFHPAIR